MRPPPPPDPPRKGNATGPRKATDPKKSAGPLPLLPDVAEPETARRGLWVVAGVFLLGLVGAVGAVGVGVYFLSPRVAKPKEETESALVRLGEAQRTWWDNEGFAGGAADPEGAMSRLADVQREWWESERLASDADMPDGPLASLESLELAWWQDEALASGKPAKTAAGALDRLAAINRQWWARARPTATAAPPSNDEPDSAGPAGDEVSVELRDNLGTRRFLEAGGSQESEKAVQLGLSWIASQQLPDGHWSFASNGRPLPNHPDAAATAMALLPFLARGYTHKSAATPNPYAKQVDAGLQYLVRRQKANGDLRAGGNLYTHALATMALCEACNMTSDVNLRDPCQRAVAFTVAAQGRDGGWRYTPKQMGDLSVTSWNLMALKSAQMAGFTIPKGTLTRASAYLASVRRADGGYNYVGKQAGHSPPLPAPMTAAGIVCSHYLHSPDAAQAASRKGGVDIILQHPPDPRRLNFYYLYYSVYALFPVGGDTWKTWNPPVRDLLVRLQNKGNKNVKVKGSWDPRGGMQLDRAGRLAVTSMALLTLEVYYRHLPLNQPELGQMTKDDLSKSPPKKK